MYCNLRPPWYVLKKQESLDNDDLDLLNDSQDLKNNNSQ